MIQTYISPSSTVFASFVEKKKQITCGVWYLYHMYHYLTNLASFRTLASLKILKIAKTSSIPPSSCLQPHHIIDSHHLCASKKPSQSQHLPQERWWWWCWREWWRAHRRPWKRLRANIWNSGDQSVMTSFFIQIQIHKSVLLFICEIQKKKRNEFATRNLCHLQSK